LTQYRLQKAIEMLQEGTWRVYEVAEQTGFGEYKNFSQVFKKYLHTTPKAFMQEITVGIKL
jgi:two-component system response regulator YesN